jgi:hypothetical protein
MYSFAQREDTEVVDEPLYASWLIKNPQVFRPYREELLQAQNTNGNEVLQEALSRSTKSIVFLKHIGKQFAGVERKSLYDKRAKHVFLVRDPFEMITSWGKKNDIHQEGCTLETMGLPLLCDLYSDLRANAANKPIVIDSDLLKASPREMLTLLCARLDIEFSEKQLTWASGPKPGVDGYILSHPFPYSSKRLNFISIGFGQNIGMILSIKQRDSWNQILIQNINYFKEKIWSCIVMPCHFMKCSVEKP